MRRRRKTVTWGGVAVAAGLAVAAVACGDDSADDASTQGTETGSTEVDDIAGDDTASPFVVGAVPEGLELAAAGEGTQQQDWGSDSFGTHEPFTVLGPEDGRADDDLVVVSVTGFEGYQGGLAQASAGYLDDPEQFELDGRDAIYSPADDERWADLVVDRGDDLAVRVTAPDTARDDLAAIAERVQPHVDYTRAPVVPEPPDGMAVIGSVDAGMVVSLYAYVDEQGGVPGTDRAFGAGWTTGPPPAPSDSGELPPDSTDLTVVSHPGDTADLDALAGLAPFGPYSDATVTSVTIDGRPAVLIEQITPSVYENESPRTRRTVVTHAPWGDLLTAGASGDLHAVPTVDELVAALASTREATPEEWDAFVATASPSPG